MEKLSLSDAEIINISISDEVVEVEYLDWAEALNKIRFEDVIGFECFSPHRRSLSHLVVEGGADFIAKAVAVSESDSSQVYSAYSFICAWTDLPVLRVVAANISRV